MKKIQELLEEIRTVFSGKNKPQDTIFPPLLFALLQGTFNLNIAVITTLLISVMLTVFRIVRKENWVYALSGLMLVGISSFFTWFSKNCNNFFLPDLFLSGILFLAAVISNLSHKPLAAWSSHLTRNWPLNWYWHQQILPAYRDVTWLWALFIALRFLFQWQLYANTGTLTLAWMNILLGWPLTIFILVLSYVFGIWRLKQLNGPSVEEFSNNQAPPWLGQQRGF